MQTGNRYRIDEDLDACKPFHQVIAHAHRGAAAPGRGVPAGDASGFEPDHPWLGYKRITGIADL